MSHTQDIIGILREEISRGESSLGTLVDVYALLRENHLGTYEKFATAYEEYSDNDTPIDSELLKEVYKALAECPEPTPKKGLFDDL